MSVRSSTTLIAYASKHQSTREVAEEIAAEFARCGLPAELRSVERVPALDPYGAVVVGSAVYEEAWLPEASSFLVEHASELAERPLWLFSCGAVGTAGEVALGAGGDFPAPLGSLRRRLAPHDVAFFGGRLTADMLAPADRARHPALNRAVGDFRDWSEIRAWARGIAEALSAAPEAS